MVSNRRKAVAHPKAQGDMDNARIGQQRRRLKQWPSLTFVSSFADIWRRLIWPLGVSIELA